MMIPEQSWIVFWNVVMFGAGLMVVLFIIAFFAMLFTAVVDRLVITPEAKRKAEEKYNND